MNVQGEITERDYLRAQWLHIKPRRKYRIAGYVLFCLFSVALAVIICDCVSSGEFQPLVGYLAPFAIVVIVGVRIRWRSQRSYRSYPSLQGRHSYAVNDAGLTIASPNGRGEVSWNAFTKWRENSSVLLLYQSVNAWCNRLFLSF